MSLYAVQLHISYIGLHVKEKMGSCQRLCFPIQLNTMYTTYTCPIEHSFGMCQIYRALWILLIYALGDLPVL